MLDINSLTRNQMATIVAYCHEIGVCQFGPATNPGDYDISKLFANEMHRVYNHCVNNDLDFCQAPETKKTEVIVIEQPPIIETKIEEVVDKPCGWNGSLC